MIGFLLRMLPIRLRTRFLSRATETTGRHIAVRMDGTWSTCECHIGINHMQGG